MKFHFKITTWEEVTIDDDQELQQEIFEKIKDGTITCANDIYNKIDHDHATIYTETIGGTDQQMTPEENNNISTIDVIDDNGNTIWSNV